MRKAVVDVGSNSLILVVEETDGVRWRSIRERTAVTSLGEGTKSTGVLGEKGMTSSLAALASFFDDAKSLGAESIVAAGTMAVRIARNQQEFLDRAAGQGTPVTVLSGDDEAQLGFNSVAHDPAFAVHDTISVIDPGGQSTELMTADRSGTGWTIRFRKSYPVGTLGLRSTLLTGESPEPPAILTASAAIDDLIGDDYRGLVPGFAIVLGATGTNLVSIRERMTQWQPEKVHGAWLDFEEISRFVGWTMPMGDAERAGIVGIEPGRERTIHIGALIVERFLNAVGAPGCAVSVRGWRHALLEQGLPQGNTAS